MAESNDKLKLLKRIEELEATIKELKKNYSIIHTEADDLRNRCEELNDKILFER